MTCRPTCIQPSPSNAHCGACHHTFSGVSAFDRHRRNGECLSPLTIGLRADRKGVWRYPAPDPTKRVIWPHAAAICCDLHGVHCEAPSELCCERCTEAAHVGLTPHADGSRCVLADHQARLAEEA